FDLDYVFNPIFSDNISTEKCIYIKTPSSHLKPANPQTPSYILDVCGVFLQITDSQYSLREKYFNYLL
ncbi:TPA: hypothetical protein ACQZE1_005212, partial [Escherichia coli]